MTTTIVHCDRCGEVVNEDRTKLLIDCGPHRTSGPVDLCRICGNDWREWLAAPLKNNDRPTAGR